MRLKIQLLDSKITHEKQIFGKSFNENQGG
jgi:hypothetical protein